MQEELIGTWVGKLEEWDEDAIFISNGYEFGHQNHKGAECTNNECCLVIKEIFL